MKLKNEIDKFKTNHYLVNFNPRWSIKDSEWFEKTRKISPEFQSVTFLKPDMSNYIKILDIGNSEKPQKKLNIDLNYVTNIVFQNEFEIYPDRFSCSIQNTDNQNEIVVSRIDKTRMGWEQKLKAITNIQLLPKTSTCVFVRKDILDKNINAENLDINLTTFNTNIHINKQNISYQTPINKEGYKQILNKIIKDNFEKQSITNNHSEEKLIKKKYLSLILPDNITIVKLLKNIFKSIDIFEQSKSNSDIKSIYFSLNLENKQKFKIAILKIILSHIIISEGNKHNTLNNISIDKKESQIIVKDKIIKIDKRIKNKNINIIFTKNYINIKSKIHKKHLHNFLKIKNNLDTNYLKSVKDLNQNYKIILEILILSTKIF